MTTTTQSQVWWRTAANPPCSRWCRGGHEPDEFQQGASMLCCHTIVVTDELQVDLQPCHYGEDQPGKIESDEATVYLELKFASESTEIARAIHGAESLAMTSSQGQGDRGGASMNAADTIAAMRADVEEFKVGLHNLDPSKAAELPAQAKS